MAIKVGGNVGMAAKAVATALHPHFMKEEEYALPQLGLLSPIAAGKISPEMFVAIEMSDRLKADLYIMLKEHSEIVALLEVLADAASKEGYEDALHFAYALKMHAQTEEEVLYPASILIGEYLKLILE